MTGESSPSRRRARPRRPKRLIGPIFIAAYCVFIAGPLAWMISIAFKPPEDYVTRPPRFFPSEPTLDHFRAMDDLDAWRSLGNSLKVALTSSGLAVVIGSMAGYATARYGTGGKRFAFGMLSQRFLPPIAMVVPIFLLIRWADMVDTLRGLILVYTAVVLPFSTWVARSFFLMIPRDYEEAASMDGASRIRTIWHVVLPLSRPALISIFAFTFVAGWTEFIFASVLTRNQARTLPMVIAGFQGSQTTLLGELAVIVIMAIVPAIVISVWFQRHAVAGLAGTGVKG